MQVHHVPTPRRITARKPHHPAKAVIVEAVECRVLLSASLVKDINALAQGSDPQGLVDLNGVTLFAATDPTHGTELWRTDGTAAGTSLVKDIVPGMGSSSPQEFVQFNGAVYFAVRGPDGGGIWKTDGTAAGTTEVLEPTDPRDNPNDLTPLGNQLLFIGKNQTLWVTDGTPSNAHQLTNPSLLGVTGLSFGSTPLSLLPVGNNVFFEGVTPHFEYALFKTDGTGAGTTLVKSLGNENYGTSVPVITAAGGKVFFNLSDSNSGVWVTDGTAAGTVQITPNDVKLLPKAVASNGILYFTSQYPSFTLWKSDGTPAGTSVIVTSLDTYPVVSGQYVYYGAGLGAGTPELYRTDGTAAGTIQLTSQPPRGILPDAMADVNGELFFGTFSYPGVADATLWKSDGTMAGTILLKDVPGTFSPDHLAGIRDTLYFSADDGSGVRALWTSDGTAAGTVMLTDPRTGTVSSNPTDGVDVNGELFFVANDGIHGPELWKSDGSDAGTSLVADLNPDQEATAGPFDLTNVNGTLYFLEDVSQPGKRDVKLFRTDGTAARTVPVATVSLPPEGNSGFYDPQLTKVGGSLYYLDSNGLWKTDPSSDTATQVGSVIFHPGEVLIPNGNLLFEDAQTGGLAGSLSVLVGNSSGSLGNGPVLRPIDTAGGTGLAPAADVLDGLLYYVGVVAPPGSADATEPVLYRTDGTPQGTVQLRQFPGDQITQPLSPSANDEGTQLYAVDGKLMLNLRSGIWMSSGPDGQMNLFQSGLQLLGRPVALNGVIYYAAYDSSTGVRQLWRTDGTSGGTVLLKDNAADPLHDLPLAVYNNLVYFTAPSGQILWQTDGTPQGTIPVPGIPYDPVPSHTNNTTILGVSGGKLYFSPSDPETGNELWKIEPAPTIRGTSGNDTITLSVTAGGILQATVNGKTTNYPLAQYGNGFTVDTGSASGTGDVLNIVGLPPVPVQVQSEGPLSVYVGGGHRGMQDVAATNLTIGAANAQQGKISLTLDDGGDTTPRSVTLDATQIGGVPYGTLTGLSPGTIAFNAQQTVSPVTIYGGTGGNTFTINHTAAGPAINLSTGEGNDTVNVLGTAAGMVLNINGKSGTDTVNIGNSTQGNILGAVNVANAQGKTNLRISPNGAGGVQNATLDTFSTAGTTYGSLQGFAPAPINFAGAQMSNVFINFPGQADSLTVKNTPGGGQINVGGLGTANVLGVASGQVLEILADEAPETVTVDFSSGRIAAGSTISTDAEQINVIGASASDAFTVTGNNVNHAGAMLTSDTLPLLSLSLARGTYSINGDLGGEVVTADDFGVVADGRDAHVIINATQHNINYLPIHGGLISLSPGADLFTRGGLPPIDGTIDIGTSEWQFGFSESNPSQDLRKLIRAGLMGAQGITSSAADSSHGIGYMANEVKYTFDGDANLDGKVDFTDLLALAQNYGKSDAYWYQGDFNYDGKVDFADLLKLSQNYGKSLAAGVLRRRPLVI